MGIPMTEVRLQNEKPADNLDIASDLQVAEVETRVAAARLSLAKGREIRPKEKCHACDEQFETGSKKLFCDGECASFYETYVKRR